MASYVDAAAIVSFGSAMVIYQRTLGLAPAEIGWASGALTLGIALGALVGGRLGDRFGRRPIFTATMALIIVASLILAWTEWSAVIVAGAILLGLGTGADLPVSLSTIAEAASDDNRGRLIGLSQILWFVGILAAIGLGIAFGNAGRFGGQVMFAHLAVVAVAILLARLTIPESEEWIAARSPGRSARLGGGFVDLLTGPWRAPLVGLVVFYSLTNLSANTMGQFGTYLLVNVAGLDVPGASRVALLLLPLGILGTLWFMAIADGQRRFAYFTVGATLLVLGNLVPVLFGFSVASYVGSRVLAMAGAAFAGEAIMKVWTQEAFPTLLRTTAQGAVIAIARLAAAGAAVATPWLITTSVELLYAVLTVFCAVGVGTAWLLFRPSARATRARMAEAAAGTQDA